MNLKKILLIFLLLFSVGSLFLIVVFAKNKRGIFGNSYDRYILKQTAEFSKTISNNLNVIEKEVEMLAAQEVTKSMFVSYALGEGIGRYRPQYEALLAKMDSCEKIQIVDTDGKIAFSSVPNESYTLKVKESMVRQFKGHFSLRTSPLVHFINSEQFVVVYPAYINKDGNNYQGFVLAYYPNQRLLQGMKGKKMKIPFSVDNFVFLSSRQSIQNEDVGALVDYYRKNQSATPKEKKSNAIGGVARIKGLNIIFYHKDERYLPPVAWIFILINLCLLGLVLFVFMQALKEEKQEDYYLPSSMQHPESEIPPSMRTSDFDEYEFEQAGGKKFTVPDQEEIRELVEDIEQGEGYPEPKAQKGIEEMIMSDDSVLTASAFSDKEFESFDDEMGGGLEPEPFTQSEEFRSVPEDTGGMEEVPSTEPESFGEKEEYDFGSLEPGEISFEQSEETTEELEPLEPMEEGSELSAFESEGAFELTGGIGAEEEETPGGFGGFESLETGEEIETGPIEIPQETEMFAEQERILGDFDSGMEETTFEAAAETEEEMPVFAESEPPIGEITEEIPSMEMPEFEVEEDLIGTETPTEASDFEFDKLDEGEMPLDMSGLDTDGLDLATEEPIGGMETEDFGEISEADISEEMEAIEQEEIPSAQLEVEEELALTDEELTPDMENLESEIVQVGTDLPETGDMMGDIEGIEVISEEPEVDFDIPVAGMEEPEDLMDIESVMPMEETEPELEMPESMPEGQDEGLEFDIDAAIQIVPSIEEEDEEEENITLAPEEMSALDIELGASTEEDIEDIVPSEEPEDAEAFMEFDLDAAINAVPEVEEEGEDEDISLAPEEMAAIDVDWEEPVEAVEPVEELGDFSALEEPMDLNVDDNPLGEEPGEPLRLDESPLGDEIGEPLKLDESPLGSEPGLKGAGFLEDFGMEDIELGTADVTIESLEAPEVDFPVPEAGDIESEEISSAIEPVIEEELPPSDTGEAKAEEHIDFHKVFSEPPIKLSTISDVEDYAVVAEDLAKNRLNFSRVLVLKKDQSGFGQSISNNFGKEIKFGTDDPLVVKFLEKRKSIDIRGDLSSANYLKQRMPVEELNQLEELIIVPILKESDVAGLAIYGREKGVKEPTNLQKSELHNLGFLQSE